MRWRVARRFLPFVVLFASATLSGCLGGWGGTPPVAVATARPDLGPAPLTVVFDASLSASGTEGIVESRWDFGAAGKATGAQATRTYAVPGTYAVTLTVADSAGRTSQDTVSILVTDSPSDRSPVARFTAEPAWSEAPLQVHFDGSGSCDPGGRIVAYAWDFGDTWQGTGAQTTHTYESPGWYTATLSVTDDAGNSGEIAATILCQGQCGG